VSGIASVAFASGGDTMTTVTKKRPKMRTNFMIGNAENGIRLGNSNARVSPQSLQVQRPVSIGTKAFPFSKGGL
jgi:hypothetical protein